MSLVCVECKDRVYTEEDYDRWGGSVYCRPCLTKIAESMREDGDFCGSCDGRGCDACGQSWATQEPL